MVEDDFQAAPKDENAPVTAKLTEEVTVTLSGNHKTFKTESGDYRLERYKDGKIKAFKDDQVCSNTKNVLRAINKEYKLEFTSGDFKKMHTRKLGKEIIEKMKDSAKELEMSTELPGEEKEAAHAAEVEVPTGTLFSEEEVKEATEEEVVAEQSTESEEVSEEGIEEVAKAKVKEEEVEEVAKPSIPKTVAEITKSSIPKKLVSPLRTLKNNIISLLQLFVSWVPLLLVMPQQFEVDPEMLYRWWVVGIIIFLGYVFTVMIIESERPKSKITSGCLSSTFIVVPLFVLLMWSNFWSGWNIAGVSMLVLFSLGLRVKYGKERRNARAEARRQGISLKALYTKRRVKAARAAAAEAAAEKEKAKKIIAAEAAAEKERAKQRAAAEKKRAKQRAAAEKKRQEARRKAVKEYGEAVVAAFEQGRVCLDMSKAMVTSIKGEPDEVKRSVTKRGEKLQYFYAKRFGGGKYVEKNRLGNVIHETRIDFVNGVVTGLKDL